MGNNHLGTFRTCAASRKRGVDVADAERVAHDAPAAPLGSRDEIRGGSIPLSTVCVVARLSTALGGSSSAILKGKVNYRLARRRAG